MLAFILENLNYLCDLLYEFFFNFFGYDFINVMHGDSHNNFTVKGLFFVVTPPNNNNNNNNFN
jgi:hypothetical protein